MAAPTSVARRALVPAAAAVGGAAVGARAARSAQWRFASMGGSSIATAGAAGWVTDFLNAAYYARPPERRSVDDLRLAFAVLTTRWHQLGHRRLRSLDVAAFHRVFVGDRLRREPGAPRGTLERDQLLAGAARLLGRWFPDAYADPSRRGWGIVFETPEHKTAFDPGVRLRHGRLGPLTPPVGPGREQVWHTYEPVAAGDADAVAAALIRPETWPDYASEIGRFTPVRDGGLDGQTFEIEVVGQPVARVPLYLRAYVTVTRLVTAADPGPLRDYVAELNDHLLRLGRDEPPAVPDGADALAAFDLTTHEGHFLGHARNRLVLYRDDEGAWLRAAGTWDPLRWDLAQLYDRVGYWAQHAMWGAEAPQFSMLHQLAEQAGGLAGAGGGGRA